MGNDDTRPVAPAVAQLLAFHGVVCPACRRALSQELDGIRCTGCGRLYPVRDGLPVLIRAEATPPDGAL